jgi:transcriptional regulator with XRE-family HTH domain
MTFGEKLKTARIALNLSQIELGEKVGISERSIYTYEQAGVRPRQNVLVKLAAALRVSVHYLVDEGETDTQKNIDQDYFVTLAKEKHGSKGAQEAADVISRASALFAGGELDEDDKEVFIQSLMEVYLESKAEASEKFSPQKRKRRKI